MILVKRAAVLFRYGSRNFRKLTLQAGSKGELSATIVTILGLLADFTTPWFNVLTWLFPLVILLAIIQIMRWRKSDQSVTSRKGKKLAKMALNLTVASIVLAPISLLNLASSSETGFTGSQFAAIEQLQQGITERFDRLDDALAVLNGKSDAIAKSVDEVKDIALKTDEKIESLSETTQEVANEASATRESMELSVALQMVDRAKADRDGSNQGQSLAFESLLKEGYDFQNADLSGISFKKANLHSGDFSSSKSHFSTFTDATLDESLFRKAGLRFSNMDAASAQNSDFSGIYGPFMTAKNTNFSSTKFTGANLVGADLRNANFVNADLSGATLAFANLAGADFTGAILDSTYFAGAILSDAIFKNAKFSNTNMHGVILKHTNLSDIQIENSCRHDSPREDSFEIKILEQWPSDRFSSGYEFDELTEYKYYGGISTLASQALPLCTNSKKSAVGFDISYPAYISMKVDRYYMKSAGRRSGLLQQLDNHFKNLQSAYETGPVFNGSGAKQKQFIDTLRNSMDCDSNVSTSKFNTDELIVTLLANGFASFEDVDWMKAATARVNIERAIENSNHGGLPLSGYTLWGNFFPDGTVATDLVPEAAELFKNWTQCRAQQVDGKLWLSALADPGPRSGAPSRDEVLYSGSFGYNSVEKISDGESYGKFKFGDGEASILAEVGDLSRIKGVAADLTSLGFDGAVFVFDKPDYSLSLSVPKINIAPDGSDARRKLPQAEIKVELKVEKISVHGTQRKTALIYVDTGVRQLLNGKAIVHSQ